MRERATCGRGRIEDASLSRATDRDRIYISCDSIRSSSWSTIKSFLLPFVIVFDFSQFLKFIFERVESLKREFQFYNYGSSDVNISDFVYGGYNIVARIFVFKKLFFFDCSMIMESERGSLWDSKNFWNEGRWRWVDWNFIILLLLRYTKRQI